MTALLLFLLQASLESPQEAFTRAEQFYESQDYRAAAEVYEGLRASGIEDGAVYYNLGNAYFKEGRLGLAILSYERALKLVPRDDDARANLAYANELVADALDDSPMPAALGYLLEIYAGIQPDGLARMLSVAFLLGGLGATVLLLDPLPGSRRLVTLLLVVCGVAALASGVLLTAKVAAGTEQVDAIVLTNNAYVRSGPGEANPRLAEIHEGLKVRVLAERPQWYQVSLSNGLTGWLRREEVEVI